MKAEDRRRLIGTASLCGTASALWIVPSTFLPGAETSPLLVFTGLVIPAGVAGLIWSIKYKDGTVAGLDTRTTHRVHAERKRVSS